ncbi:MAG: hypothetical protein DRQ97_13755, partial [Gammaproteobacteria bacterium]
MLTILTTGLLGCGGDSPTSVGTTTASDQNAGVLRGSLNPGDIDFEIISEANGDPDNPEPGPYALRGRNLRFDAELGGIVVDLSVENLGDDSYSEPITLTFISLSPEGLTVANSDNGESGPVARIVFSMPDDDGQWTPAEESLARETAFDVAAGTSISFVARVDAGSGFDGMGSIGGIVFNDANGNGTMDMDESGVGGVMIQLSADGTDMQSMETSEDGCYRFDGLEAGFYTVTKLAKEGVVPTTPVEFFVTLTENSEGVVNTFLLANFGCQVGDSDDRFEIGDCVHVDGFYDAASATLVATKVHIHNHHHDHGHNDWDDDDEDHDKSSRGYGNCGKQELRGLITDRNRDERMIEIMGTKVKVDDHRKDGHPDHHNHDLEVGDRARVDIHARWPHEEMDFYYGHKLKTHKGKHDRIRGFVQEVSDG